MPNETFHMIECACEHWYVRSDSRESNWDCPACGETVDRDALFEVQGPERSLTEEEGLALLHGGV